MTGVRVTDLMTDNGSVRGVETARGKIDCDYMVVGAGPWINTFWDMLGLPVAGLSVNAAAERAVTAVRA